MTGECVAGLDLIQGGASASRRMAADAVRASHPSRRAPRAPPQDEVVRVRSEASATARRALWRAPAEAGAQRCVWCAHGQLDYRPRGRQTRPSAGLAWTPRLPSAARQGDRPPRLMARPRGGRRAAPNSRERHYLCHVRYVPGAGSMVFSAWPGNSLLSETSSDAIAIMSSVSYMIIGLTARLSLA